MQWVFLNDGMAICCNSNSQPTVQEVLVESNLTEEPIAPGGGAESMADSDLKQPPVSGKCNSFG